MVYLSADMQVVTGPGEEQLCWSMH